MSERYIAKSNPYIVMVSTPNAPDGLFERIEKEPEETCLYRRLFLDYTYGLDRIYTQEEIAKAKESPPYEKSIVERTIEYLKDRTEAFDDYYPCIRTGLCNLQHVYQWLILFVFMHNSVIKSNAKFTNL